MFFSTVLTSSPHIIHNKSTEQELMLSVQFQCLLFSASEYSTALCIFERYASTKVMLISYVV